MSTLDRTRLAVSRVGRRARAWRGTVESARGLATPPVAATLVAVTFVSISVWWLLTDVRVPDGDAQRHLNYALSYRDLWQSGDWLGPFEEYRIYPPLVHLLGAVAILLAGIDVAAPVLAQNAVFVPLLALGCYGAGSVAFDRRVGALAVVFAFGVPMLISQFHVFMLDAPLTAMVAVSVWLLLASERFARRGYALAAGVAVAVGLMTKNTLVLFVAGLILVMLLRGGWRQWRNVLVFALPVALLAAPWYLGHLGDLAGHTEGLATASGPVTWYAGVPYPDRFSPANFTWYGWAFVNAQYFLPLALFFFIGLVWAVVGLVRGWARDSYLPELLFGGAVAYVAVSWLAVDDPRYTLPCLVYVSTIGTFWLVRLPRPARYAAVAALALVSVMNTVLVNFHSVETKRIALGKVVASPIQEQSLKVISSTGYVEGPPFGDVQIIPAMEAARREGVKTISFGGDLGYHFFNGGGLYYLARSVRLRVGNDRNHLGPGDVHMYRLFPDATDAKPCFRINDGTGVFMNRGDSRRRPLHENPLYCPIPSSARSRGGPE